MDWKQRLQKSRRPSKPRHTAALPPLPGAPSDSAGGPSRETVPDISVAQTSPRFDALSSARAEDVPGRFSVLSASHRLWNVAYDNLENDAGTAVLARTYIELLHKTLGFENAPHPSVPSRLSSESSKRIDREIYMRDLAVKGSSLKGPAVANPTGIIIRHVLSLRDMIDRVFQDRSQTALPWPGVCVGMQILLNPGSTNTSHLRGIVHIGSMMEWYCDLTEIISEETTMARHGRRRSRAGLAIEKSVVNLYKAILLYQMKSVYSYAKSQFPKITLNVVGLEDWDFNLDQVTAAEKTVLNQSEQYGGRHFLVSRDSFSRLKYITETTKECLFQQNVQDLIDQKERDIVEDMDTTVMLQDLFVLDQQDEMSRLEVEKDELVYDVYNWFLGSKEYAAWTNWSQISNPPSPSQVLLVNGLPGTGKTMLFIGVIRHLLSQPAILTPTISYVFCQRANLMMNNATAVLRSLLWMLLTQQPNLASHLLSKYKYAGHSLFRDGNAFFALVDALTDMLKDSQLPRVYFIIDALDECGEGRDHLHQGSHW